MGSWLPNQGWNLSPPASQGGCLTTGPPGKFPEFLVKLGQHHFPNGVDPETSAISPRTPVSVPRNTLWDTLTLCNLLSQLSLWVIQKSERLNTWPSEKFNNFIVVLGTSLRSCANIMQEIPIDLGASFLYFPDKVSFYASKLFPTNIDIICRQFYSLWSHWYVDTTYNSEEE